MTGDASSPSRCPAPNLVQSLAASFAIGWVGLVAFSMISAVLASTNLRRAGVADSLGENSLIASELVLSTRKDAETSQRGYLLTGDLAYLELNHAAQRRLKTNFALLEMSISSPRLSLVHSDGRTDARKKLDRALDPNDPHDASAFDYRAVHPDGRIVHVSSIGHAVFEPDPDAPAGRRPRAVIGTAHDATKIRSAEKQERYHAAVLLQTIVDTAPGLVERQQGPGFGMRLIEHLVEQDPAGKCVRDFAAAGLVCTINARLAEIVPASAVVRFPLLSRRGVA